MISQLRGKTIYKSDKYIIIDVGGVGFKVFGRGDLISSCIENKEILVWTYLAVRENALDLYGFNDKEELRFFEMLLTVSGIGPKTAMNILSVSSVDLLKRAISTGDISHLVKVSGIGKKVADKIVLELKGKAGISEGDDVNLKDEIDAVEALKAIGFSQRDARDALSEVDKKITNTSLRVKEALKILGK
jgi:Holliday junction DNA helicase RuvA